MTFTHDWFTTGIENWTNWLAPLKGQPVRALEIGCYEGRATCWLLENILTHPEARITVVDTFAGSEEHKLFGVEFANVRSNFEHNVQPWSAKVSVFTGTSASVVRHFNGPFDFAYIDGSHLAPDVLTDACMVWPLIVPGGIMIFDDYLWPGVSVEPMHKPRPAIDAFLSIFHESYDLIAKGYQVCVRRTAGLPTAHDAPTVPAGGAN